MLLIKVVEHAQLCIQFFNLISCFIRKKPKKIDIENGDLLHKLFLTIGIDYSELDAVLRARRFVLIWQRRVATAHTGGHKVNLNLRGKISCRLLSCKKLFTA